MALLSLGRDRRTEGEKPIDGFLDHMRVLARQAVLFPRMDVPNRGAGLIGLDSGFDVLFHGIGLQRVLLARREGTGGRHIDDQLLVHGSERRLGVQSRHHIRIDCLDVRMISSRPAIRYLPKYSLSKIQ